MPPPAHPTQRPTSAEQWRLCAAATPRAFGVVLAVFLPLVCLLPESEAQKAKRRRFSLLPYFSTSFFTSPPPVSSLAMARLAFALLALFAVSAYAAPEVSFGGGERWPPRASHDRVGQESVTRHTARPPAPFLPPSLARLARWLALWGDGVVVEARKRAAARETVSKCREKQLRRARGWSPICSRARRPAPPPLRATGATRARGGAGGRMRPGARRASGCDGSRARGARIGLRRSRCRLLPSALAFI